MKKHQSGVALLEALLAILILAIGLLGTIGLQARAYSALNDAGQRSEATIATEKLLGLMANDQANLAAYAINTGVAPTSPQLQNWYAETLAAIPNAGIKVAVTAPPAGSTRTQVDIAISWQRKGGDAGNVHRVTAYLAQSL
ncbi:MAG TPA: hypothetical protein VGP06_01150 [Janthinobacterium sp.]|jgi:type IV pilus assembly protein PilV|nr:hypothetical protein [Janthinobacterium sp.]